MSNNTFIPQSNLFARTVTVASQAISPVLIAPPPVFGNNQVPVTLDHRFRNTGSVDVFIAWADPGATAPIATIPGDGANAKVLVIEANSTRTFQFAYLTQFAVIASGAGSTLYCQIGSGNNA